MEQLTFMVMKWTLHLANHTKDDIFYSRFSDRSKYNTGRCSYSGFFGKMVET